VRVKPKQRLKERNVSPKLSGKIGGVEKKDFERGETKCNAVDRKKKLSEGGQGNPQRGKDGVRLYDYGHLKSQLKKQLKNGDRGRKTPTPVSER